MFSLLVHGLGWEPPHGKMDLSRLFEQTDPSINGHFNKSGSIDLIALSSLPTLLIPEPETDYSNQTGRIGTVYNLKLQDQELTFDFSFDATIPPIPMETILSMSKHFGTSGYGLNRTHWAIKNFDLFELLFRHQLAGFTFPNARKLKAVKQNQVALMMPFSSSFDPVRDAVFELCSELGFTCLRADNIWENDVVIDDIFDLISESKLIIYDLTGKNPNVLYEAGIAHALEKKTVLITQNEDDIPFDLKALRYAKYLPNEQGVGKLKNDIRQRVIDLMSEN